MIPFLSGQPVSPKKNPGRLNLKAAIPEWNALELVNGQASSPKRIPLEFKFNELVLNRSHGDSLVTKQSSLS